MNMVVRDTLEAAEVGGTTAKEAAALDAQQAALPFQEEQLRAEHSMYNYSMEARVLATAAAQLKKDSMELARESKTVQGYGSNNAQSLQAAAQAMMRKALELESQAQGAQRRAEEMRGGLGVYALRAQAAAARAALRANPGGDVPPQLPAPPPPLTPPPPAAAPAAAPAPAS